MSANASVYFYLRDTQIIHSIKCRPNTAATECCKLLQILQRWLQLVDILTFAAALIKSWIIHEEILGCSDVKNISVKIFSP